MNFDDVNNRIITIRNQAVLLDADVAAIYGVQTMHINQAVKNNPGKFPEGYIFELSKQEWRDLRALIIANGCKSDRSEHLIKCFDKMLINNNKSRNYLKSYVVPKAFTEKGLYMLATILKSQRATDATIAIVEAFAKMRELTSNLAILSTMEPEVIKPEIIEKTGGLLNDLLFTHFPATSSETSLEFNIGLIKGTRTIKSENGALQDKMDRMEKMIEEIKEQLKK